MDRIFSEDTSGRMPTSKGEVYIHKGYVLGIFVGETLRPWVTLDEATRDCILIDLAGATIEA